MPRGRPIYLPVRHSEDLRRILALPEREYDQAAASELAAAWNHQFLNPKGLELWHRIAVLPAAERDAAIAAGVNVGKARLPICINAEQAFSLRELILGEGKRGVVVGAPVGIGKTLLIWLMCYAAQTWFGLTRTGVLTTAGLRRQMVADFAKLSRVWKTPPYPPVVIGLGEISKQGGEFTLAPYAFQMVIQDEADELRNPESAKTLRIMREIARPDAIACFTSGTFMRFELEAFGHLFRAALGDGSPTPHGRAELSEWTDAFHAGKAPGTHRPAGALEYLIDRYPSAQNPELRPHEAVAEAIGCRIERTPGVCLFTRQSCTKPIRIKMLAAPRDPIIEAEFLRFRATEATLDGWVVSDALSMLRLATEIGTGYYSVIDPRPPKAWRDAKNAEARFIRDKCRATRRTDDPWDSASRVRAECPNAPEVLAWKQIGPTFKPKSRDIPLSLSVAVAAVDWLRDNSPALIYTTSKWLGRTIAQLSGLPFYHAGGKTDSGEYISDLDPRRSAVVSVHSNYKGREGLQRWQNMLVIGLFHSAPWWEQLLGRLHRQLQEGAVNINLMATCAETLVAIERAVLEAGGARSIERMPKKLTLAEWDWSEFPDQYLYPDPETDYAARWRNPDRDD